jgi:hypothetical protein
MKKLGEELGNEIVDSIVCEFRERREARKNNRLLKD